MFSMKKLLMKTAVVLAVVILACSCGYTATINVHWTAALQNKKIVQDRANALKVAKELNDCKRIEILSFPGRYRVIIANKNDRNASNIIGAVRKLIRNRNAITEDGVAALITSYYFRFHVSSDTAYVAKFDAKARYFEISEKIRIRKQKGEEVTETIQLLSVPFCRPPSDFINKMKESLYHVDRDYPRAKPWKFQ